MTLRVAAMILALAAAAVPPAFAEKSAGKPKASTPADIIKIMESSKITYTMSEMSSLKDVDLTNMAGALWPQRSKALVHPHVDKDAGASTLIEYRETKEEADAIATVEPAYEKKDYDSARAGFLDVVAKLPDSYLAHLYLGDSYFGLGDNEKALTAYRRAIKINPDDHVGYTFEGHALAKLGKKDEAIAAWTHALALRPRDELTTTLAHRFADGLGIVPHTDGFQPKAFVRREKDGVTLYMPADGGAAWMVWAACKAVWLGEPGYATAHGGTTTGWSSAEDRECTVHLLVEYSVLRKKGDVPADPELDRLLPLLDDGFLDEFVIYEFGARYAPDATLLVGDPKLDMDGYVRKYVLH